MPTAIRVYLLLATSFLSHNSICCFDPGNETLHQMINDMVRRIDSFEKEITKITRDNDNLREKVKRDNEILREIYKRDITGNKGYEKNGDIPVGTILPFAGSNFTYFFGQDWLPCDGQIVSQDQYPSLFEVIGTIYNTDSLNNETHFQLPDFRGRVLVGSGHGESLTPRFVGEYLGEERHTLSADEMPSHNHAVSDPGHGHSMSAHYFHHYSGSNKFYSQYNAGDKIYSWDTTFSKTGISIGSAGASKSHTIIQPSSVVSYIIKAPKVRVGPTPWPKPNKLIGFWPLNAIHQNEDASPNKVVTVANVEQMAFVPGPFGGSATAAVMGGKIETSGIRTGNSFTLSFFLQSKNITGSAGLFEFSDKYETPKAFQVRRYNKTTIEVSANGISIGFYRVLQPEDAWTFLAFTFDGLTADLTVYGRHGVIVPSTFQPHVLSSSSFNNDGFRVGHTSRWNESLSDGDYVSCVMLYSMALTARQIRQAYDSCRIIHGSVPCGSPKLPMPAIPSATSMTTLPKQGEFPYVASIRMNSKHICSANIIDEYWLVTLAQCFQEGSDPSVYQVYVGEFDLGVEETYTQHRSCSQIIIEGLSLSTLYPSSGRNIALIQVDRAIDFTSDYVNNVCLFTEDNVKDLTLDTTQFVFGWGVNGRQPFVSETLGRIVPGVMLTESQCERAWGPKIYDSEKDVCFMSSSSDKNVPCKNDEGSPLLVQAHGYPETGIGDHLVAVGLYYTRSANCSAEKPAAFVNLAKYSTWIVENIACAIPGWYYPESCPQNTKTPSLVL